MTSTTFAQRLEGGRWQPYKYGTLVSLPVTVVITLFWIYNDVVAWAWFLLHQLVCSGWYFRTTPFQKMISWALLLGTYFAFAIWYLLIINPHFHPLRLNSG